MPVLVLSRKYPSFGGYETDYRRQGLDQEKGETYYTDQRRQQERGGGFGQNNGWPNNFGSDQFVQPFNQQNIFSPHQQLSRRYSLDGNDIIEDVNGVEGTNNNFNDVGSLDREAKDEYYNFGGFVVSSQN